MRRCSWIRDRLGRRGAVAVAAAGVLLLVALIAVPLSIGGGERPACGKAPCATPKPWLSPPRLPRPITPIEAATQGGYVALGDSFSAGVGAYATPDDQAPGNLCRRTSQAYPQLIARDFRFANGLAFWACSGARTGNVLHGQAGEPPQIDRLDAGTSLVTISIGGNDTGFAGVLAGCVIKLPFTAGCRTQGLEISTRLDALRDSLKTVYRKIVERAPNARVLVLGYPRLFAEDSSGSFNISVVDQQWLNTRGRELNQLIRQAALAEDLAIVAARGKGSVEFVDCYSAFAGHEVGSAQPYVNGLNVNLAGLTIGAESFHPTAPGYQALSELVRQQIKGGPGRPILQYR